MEKNSLILIGKVTGIVGPTGKRLFSIIARYNLMKVDLTDLISIVNSDGSDLLSAIDVLDTYKVYFNNDSGDAVNLDVNNDQLVAFDPKLLLEDIIRKRKREAYFLYTPLIALLESMMYQIDFQVVIYQY